MVQKTEKSYRVLILESGSGGGHISISEAVSEALEKYPVTVQREDIVPALLHKIYRRTVRNTTGAAAEFHQLIYKLSNNPGSAELTAAINSIVNRRKFKKIVESCQPDLIFSNTSLAVREVPIFLREFYHRIPFLVYVADPISIHSTWFSPLTDLTMTSTIHVYQKALEHGLSPSQVMITGHPVRRQFYKSPAPKKVLRENLGLDPRRFTIFFGGSGEGSERVREILKLLKERGAEFQGIVVAGRNPKLIKEVAALGYPDRRLKIFEYTNEMAALLYASDLVAAKAGPNLIFEAVIAGRPFLATHHIRGQEDGNLDIIRYAQIGWVEEDPEKAVTLIEEIIENPNLIQTTKLGIKYFAQAHRPAADKIAKMIYRHLTDIPLTIDWGETSPTRKALIKAAEDLGRNVRRYEMQIKTNPEIAPVLQELRENWKKVKEYMKSVD